MSQRTTPIPSRNILLRPAFMVALGVLVVSAVALGSVVSVLKLHLKKAPIEVDQRVNSIPEQTPSWVRLGPDIVEEEAMVEELGTTNYLTRRYVERHPKDAGKPISLDLHLAYYTGMIDTVPHVPERCLVGGGWVLGGATSIIPLNLDETTWDLDDAATREAAASNPGTPSKVYSARLSMDSAYTKSPGVRVRLPRDADTISMRITPFIQPGSDRRMFAGYFFVANGGHVPSAEDVRLLAFKLDQYYAYYLKVQVSSQTVTSEAELAQAAGSLMSELLPEIMRCVPDWTDVDRGDYPPDNPKQLQAAGRGTSTP
jgi:hypothetical protein